MARESVRHGTNPSLSWQGLNTGLLVVEIATTGGSFRVPSSNSVDDFHLLVNMRNYADLRLRLGISSFHVAADLVRANLAVPDHPVPSGPA